MDNTLSHLQEVSNRWARAIWSDADGRSVRPEVIAVVLLDPFGPAQPKGTRRPLKPLKLEQQNDRYAWAIAQKIANGIAFRDINISWSERIRTPDHVSIAESAEDLSKMFFIGFTDKGYNFIDVPAYIIGSCGTVAVCFIFRHKTESCI